jgi:tRNA-dihydrouridine synthase A
MPAVSSHPISRRFSAAPMMSWSDTHCRYFWRLLTKNTPLYTEMVTTGALIHGDRQRFLYYHPAEHPLALQLGGSNPTELAQCARMAEDAGYDEVNLNCGCPSERVQNNMIGACLMTEPDLVAECIATMQDAVRIPVTVKHRIGVDDMDDYSGLRHFVDTVASAGCKTFIVHARKAWLKGLSPKENRDVPPLQYDKVIQLKRERPDLEIVINGGITTLEQCRTLLGDLDGVMVGREAYTNPYLLAQVDQELYGSTAPVPTRIEVLDAFTDYVKTELERGVPLKYMTRHILGLFQGVAGARQFRRTISDHAHKAGAGLEVLASARRAIVA